MTKKIHKSEKYLLLLFPLIFLTLQVLLKIDYRFFFMSVHDPAYAFLFNGLNLARGELGSGLAGFPGTPVQIFVALIIRLGYLFRGVTSLTEDVFTNPEYYLNIASYGIVLLISLSLLFSGTILYRHTYNLEISLGIQLAPFLSLTGMHFNSIVMCEPFLVLAIQGIILQLALYCYTKKAIPEKRQIIYLSIFTALGITTKIVFIPVFLLPFFVISRWTDRLKYILITFFTSAVLLIPAYPDLHLFVNWFKLLLFHKGIYGSGESGIIDWNLFINNLKLVFSTDILFTTIFILIFSYLIMRNLPGIKEKIHQINYRILAGIFTVIIVQLIMIGKHYLPHYMVTAYSLIMFAFILWLTGFKKPAFLIKRGRWLFLICVGLTGIFLTIRFIKNVNFSANLRHPYLETVEYIDSHVGDEPRIIVEEGSSAFKELGLYFGMVYSGSANQKYRTILNKLYPVTYFYNNGQERYFDWNTDYSLVEILSKNESTYLFRKSKTDSIPALLLNEILFLKNSRLITAFTMDFKNPKAFDYLYKIVSDTCSLKKIFMEKESITCNCETLSEDGASFESTVGDILFEKAYMRSSEKVYNGEYSVKLTPYMPYALDIKLASNKNDYIKAFVWRKSQDTKGLIVLTDDIPDGICRAGAKVIQTKDGWERINLNFRIPENFQGNQIHLFLWYNGKDSCYFDDFEVLKY